jgi:hypothetical protein
LELPTALPAHPRRRTGLGKRRRAPVIRHDPLAATAVQKRLTLFYPKQRDEKQADVMVYLPEFGLMQPAPRAVPGRRIHGPGSGLNTGDQKKHWLNP